MIIYLQRAPFVIWLWDCWEGCMESTAALRCWLPKEKKQARDSFQAALQKVTSPRELCAGRTGL